VLLLLVSVSGALVQVWFVRHLSPASQLLGRAAGRARPAPLLPTPADIWRRPSQDVQPIVRARCRLPRHAQGRRRGHRRPPKGVVLETAHIRAGAAINQRVFVKSDAAGT
jgi:hypothetical protein